MDSERKTTRRSSASPALVSRCFLTCGRKHTQRQRCARPRVGARRAWEEERGHRQLSQRRLCLAVAQACHAPDKQLPRLCDLRAQRALVSASRGGPLDGSAGADLL
eukprot:3732984-Rhodomonas_salina.2